jgi:Uri superfamily endonuclease
LKAFTTDISSFGCSDCSCIIQTTDHCHQGQVLRDVPQQEG